MKTKLILLLVACIPICIKTVCQDNNLQREIPILCYHNIFSGSDGKPGPLRISASQLEQQLHALASNGYHSISPDDLLQWMQGRTQLPANPVMITFDDSHLEHFTLAAPLLKQLGFRGAFFVMTVTIGKPHYLSAAQIKTLSDNGHVIGCHTWDHQPLGTGTIDWQQQLTKPKAILEKITGKPVNCFAYPYGEWNIAAIQQIKAHGFTTAFQLSNAQNSQEPRFTIRRMIVAGNWSGTQLLQKMKATFPSTGKTAR
ncbi:peptidoglycan/xylan/chitin deacetylase (PgdA/CDA1 family) [Chitinophaga polysaccharea]|uniref:Peptidoglycan/xylan/chitin deacetylase (PgdA/CDA1 family) n=1 Tax=Chitinophaga polysaccharea TaxID=1293035 RepID=A0A561Q5S1_9BACT|nr:polysaccharide deacetylase family protein [Chitinophaga polysaccharea]TWF45708.1 peptidoglycan/xylan/chitin deacetylase (PgdA/CDA1 family) [Chitinophaga polysaccharea]